MLINIFLCNQLTNYNVACCCVRLWKFMIIIINIKYFYSLWSIGHPWRASRHCGLQLSSWPRSMTFLCFLSNPLLSFATLSSAYLFFYIPEDSNLMQFCLLLLFLYVMCVQSNSIFFFFIWFSIDFWSVILHSSTFVILLVHFVFIIRPKHLFTNICSLIVIWLVVFHVSQTYNNTDFAFVVNIHILTSFDMLRFLHPGTAEQIGHLASWFYLLHLALFLRSLTPHFLAIQRIQLHQFPFPLA